MISHRVQINIDDRQAFEVYKKKYNAIKDKINTILTDNPSPEVLRIMGENSIIGTKFQDMKEFYNKIKNQLEQNDKPGRYEKVDYGIQTFAKSIIQFTKTSNIPSYSIRFQILQKLKEALNDIQLNEDDKFILLDEGNPEIYGAHYITLLLDEINVANKEIQKEKDEEEEKAELQRQKEEEEAELQRRKEEEEAELQRQKEEEEEGAKRKRQNEAKLKRRKGARRRRDDQIQQKIIDTNEQEQRLKQVLKSNFENITKTRLYDLYAKFLFVTFVLEYDFTDFTIPKNQNFHKNKGKQFRYFLDVGGDMLIHKYISPETLNYSFNVFKNFITLNHPNINVDDIPDIKDKFWSEFNDLLKYRLTLVRNYIQKYAQAIIHNRKIHQDYLNIINQWTFAYYNKGTWRDWRQNFRKNSDEEFNQLEQNFKNNLFKLSRQNLYNIIKNPQNRQLIEHLIEKN